MSMCEALGASLPLPRNEQENKDLYAILDPRGFGRIALGARVNNKGSWVDSNGDPLTYFNDQVVEPNNSNGGGRYSIFWAEQDGKWVASKGGQFVDVICQS